MYTLSGQVLELLRIDSIIFFIGVLFALIYVFKKTLRHERKWYILYIAFSFSSMNIFIKPVHDYLIVTPRTFLFYYKIFNLFSPLDITFVFLFFFVLLDIYQKKHQRHSRIIQEDVYSVILKRDLIVFCVAFIGFYFYSLDGGPCDVKTQIRSFRKIIYCIVLFYAFRIVNDRYKHYKDICRTINSLYILNFINFANQALSCFFLQDITWQRGGWSVVFLDQTDSYMCLFMFPLLFKRPEFFSKKIVWLSLFVNILLLSNYIKTLYLLLGLTIIVNGIIGIMQKRLSNKVAAVFFVTIVGVIAFVVYISNQTAVLTRQGQAEMLFDTYEKHSSSIIFGIGDGGMIRHQEATDDAGEIRAVDTDAEENSKYTTAFQVPVLSVLKTSGIVGVVLTIIYMSVVFFNCVKYNKKNLFLSISCCLFFVFSSIGSGYLIGDPQATLYVCESALIFSMVERQTTRMCLT